MPLPHPLTVIRSEAYEALFEIMGQDRVKRLKEALVQPENSLTNALHDCRDDDFLMEILQVPGPRYISNAVGLLCPIRFEALNTPVFEIDPSLSELLVQTDIGDKSPVSSFVTPFDSMFFHFPEPIEALPVGSDPDHNDELRYLSGAYLNRVYPDPETWLEFYGGKFTAYELVFTGNTPPDNPFDCLTLNTTLFFPSEQEMTLESAIKAVLVNYANAGNDTVGLQMERFTELLVSLTGHIAKCLLFISTPDAVIKKETPLTDLQERLANLKPGKRKKLERRLEKQFDRTVITYKKEPGKPNESFAPGSGHKRPHWRRGHFRSQPFGEGRKDRRTIWIRPALVSGFGEAKDASYIVK